MPRCPWLCCSILCASHRESKSPYWSQWLISSGYLTQSRQILPGHKYNDWSRDAIQTRPTKCSLEFITGRNYFLLGHEVIRMSPEMEWKQTHEKERVLRPSESPVQDALYSSCLPKLSHSAGHNLSTEQQERSGSLVFSNNSVLGSVYPTSFSQWNGNSLKWNPILKFALCLHKSQISCTAHRMCRL